MKNADFQFILDKTMSMIGVWGGKLISMAGRINLVKSILLSIPTFHSTLSLVPKQVLNEVEKLSRSFIWNKSDGNAGLHYVNWEVMCKPKKFGGLGINPCSKKYGHLRAKLAWMYGQQKDSLMHKILFPKYGPINGGEAARRRGSVTWKILCNGEKYLKPIVRWSVGNGRSIQAYKDIWLLDKSFERCHTFVNSMEDFNQAVDKFIINGEWDVMELQKHFGMELVQMIKTIKI
ncbi:Putative ribonuclease H protein [Dendrobium catenatum]|uniref:Ribonuclease H protein n=1 Tax=Dendrobium catenatum TaxID=906689 RepID=A0A2I0XC07_9ASPA|nr:Putative ribonuclease H protein [Dendrobium catenatum]